ncbi:unnamed protein product [Plutella xylostella]|uniref:(diamondback moth) hypothetical protein n=1 Tax=Plutella xylostella TaxID=51655 RepID=A0A8S4EQL4_PLUXY|nr:unnamed protein product [Plutella xylostella]
MCCDRVTFLSKFSITMNTSCCVVILLMFTNIVIVLGGAEPSECENKPSEKHCIVEYSSRYRVRHTPRWHEHFRNILEVEVVAVAEDNESPYRQQMSDICTDPPSFHEIKKAVDTLKNRKSPGADKITAEMLKVDSARTANMLYPLFKQIWITEHFPEEWKEGLLVKVPKKGDKSNCNNWRGITLLSIVSKVMTRVILTRLSASVDKTLREHQAGFRKSRSCVDHINALRIIIEQCSEWQSDLYLLFVDFEKAFDTVRWSALWKALERKGIPMKIINLIRALYDNSSCRVLHSGKLSDPIKLRAGVRQGCLLSPTLFIILLDEVLRKATESQKGIKWGSDQLKDLDYADDICLLATTLQDLTCTANAVQDEAQKTGLRVNAQKTVAMRVVTPNREQIKIGDKQVVDVPNFCYLGSVLTPTGGTDDDVDGRIKKAKGAFAQLTPIWRSNIISRDLKLRIFVSNVKSVLLYGCETWKVTKSISTKLQVCVNKHLRQILRVFWPDTISNEDLWKETRQEPINKEILRRKWSWIGHCLRRPEGNIAKMALDWNPPQGRRRKGRPATTWRRSILSDLNAVGISWDEAKERAQDRNVWRRTVEALCSSWS